MSGGLFHYNNHTQQQNIIKHVAKKHLYLSHTDALVLQEGDNSGLVESLTSFGITGDADFIRNHRGCRIHVMGNK